MKKYILILLLLVTGLAQAQGPTLPNAKYNNTETNTLKIKTPATVTSVNFLPAFDADGITVSKIDPVNLPLSTAIINAINTNATPDATNLLKGKLKLAGDLGGTADNPTTPTALHKTGTETKIGKLTLLSPSIPAGTSNLNALAPLTVTGANGGDNTNTTGFVSAGSAAEIKIKSGNGGGAFGVTGTGQGGKGGDVILLAGDGGQMLGSGSLIQGNGGKAVVQAGSAYGGIPGTGEIKAGNNFAPLGIGGSVFLEAGWGNGSPIDNNLYNGAIFLGVSSANVIRGNTVIGSNEDDRINRFQVTGNAIGDKWAVRGGLPTQFLKADGSIDSNIYIKLSEKGSANGISTLDANGKIPLSQINDALFGNVKYKGLYDGTLISSSPDVALNGTALPAPSSTNTGWYFIANASFTNSGIDYRNGDWIISNGVVWDIVDNTDAVSSVFGRVGHVTAQNGDYTTALVTETLDKRYQTDNQKLYNDATSSIQTQLNSKAVDANVLHNTGKEPFSGVKSGSNSSSPATTALSFVNNYNGGTANIFNAPLQVINNLDGIGFGGVNNGGGILYSGFNTNVGSLIKWDSSTASTGNLLTLTKNNSLTATINHLGEFTTPRITISGRNSNNVMLAGGSSSLINDTGTLIGIGTTSPNYMITSFMSATNYTQWLNSATGNTVNDGLIMGINPVGGAEIVQRENDYLRFYTNNAERVRFHASGGVSIGNTTDLGAGRLNVTGTATASPATVSTELATLGQVNAVARPYKSYVARLLQSGTSAPTATVLENTLGGTVVWTRTGAGVYVGTLAGAFTSGKTYTNICISPYNAQSGHRLGIMDSTNFISINTFSNTLVAIDDVMSPNIIEVRVYN